MEATRTSNHIKKHYTYLLNENSIRYVDARLRRRSDFIEVIENRMWAHFFALDKQSDYHEGLDNLKRKYELFLTLAGGAK